MVMLSGMIQSAHYCGLRKPGSPAALELDRGSSGGPLCLICLMAPSTSAILLLLALSVMFHAVLSLRLPQISPHPVLASFHLHIRPPPLD
jgi:hypothetical protein